VVVVQVLPASKAVALWAGHVGCLRELDKRCQVECSAGVGLYGGVGLGQREVRGLGCTVCCV